LLILGFAVLTVAIIPKKGTFKYDFEKDRPWKHETLIAPFKFTIKKSEEELEIERSALLKNFVPYFKRSADLKTNNLNNFKTNFAKAYQQQDNKRGDSLLQLNLGLHLLDTLYTTGIIDLSEKNNSLEEINVISGQVSERVKTKKLWNLKQAYRFIIDTISKNNKVEGAFLIPIVENHIEANIQFDKTSTNNIKSELLDNISLTRGLIQEGEIIVSKGVIVNQDIFQALTSFKESYESNLSSKQTFYFYTTGYGILVTLIIAIIMVAYMLIFQVQLFNSTRRVLFVVLLMSFIMLTMSWVTQNDFPTYWMIPYCILPIILQNFFGSRLAFQIHLIIVLLSSFVLPERFEFFIIQLLAGMVAIFANVKTVYWSQFFISIGLILVTYILGYLGVHFIQDGDFGNIKPMDFAWISANALLTLLAYPLIPIFEKFFGFVSNITLVELSDLNKPLLKKLSLKASGTFQHSLKVSNLAEAAAHEIGANALLAKVGALYHDVGKIEHPLIFIENQHSGINPHDDMTFEESAQAIIDHVIKGVEIAKEYNLPEILIDFIRTHHGTSRVEYFYRSFLKNFPENEVDEAKFKYPGPNPYSKETAVVMMADSIEAASRSVKTPTSESIDDLVDNIIAHKIDLNQFQNCDITFKDITRVKKVFKHMVKSFYHVRISYPK